MRPLTAWLENGYCSIIIAYHQLITVIRFVVKSYTHPWRSFANTLHLVLHVYEILLSRNMCAMNSGMQAPNPTGPLYTLVAGWRSMTKDDKMLNAYSSWDDVSLAVPAFCGCHLLKRLRILFHWWPSTMQCLAKKKIKRRKCRCIKLNGLVALNRINWSCEMQP